MYKNYLKIAFRNFLKHKAYSIINVSGLAIGLACCILIMTYVQHELSYDRYHEKSERIYRIITDEKTGDESGYFANTYSPLAPAMLTDFPEIEHAVRLFPYDAGVQSTPEKQFNEARFFFSDSTIFDVFSFRFIQGDPNSALSTPFSLVITKSTARKYFGDADPIGKTMKVEGQVDFHVTGIIADIPPNSHFKFDFLAPVQHVPLILGWNPHWHWPPFYTYVLLREDANPEGIQSRFPQFITKHIKGMTSDDRLFHLQPLSSIHLNPNLQNEIEPTSNMAYVYLFSGIAFFILLIACINFMNLATARSAKRAREVGLRKVVGAKQEQLIRQFLGESLFYTILAMLLALVLVEMFSSTFNRLVDRDIDISYFTNLPIFFGLVGLTVLVGLLAGSYPALFLSRFRPLKVLQNKILSTSATGGAPRFRSVLVVLQFTISIALIIVTMIVSGQLSYIQNKQLGFNKEQIVVIPVRDEVIQNNFETVKNSLLSHSDVLSAAALSNFPWKSGFYGFPGHADGMPEDIEMNLPILLVDHDFVKTFEMEILNGRDFSKDFSTDRSHAVIVNETAVESFGWDSGLRKKLTVKHIATGADVKGEVVGIVRDFHFQSLHHPIEPLVMLIAPVNYYIDNIAIRIKGQNISQTLDIIEQKWHEFVPSRPFTYFFLDDDFDQLYKKEGRLASIFQGFAGLAIFIACLGLFGLVSFSAEQRRKEIGIRKTLGATVTNITTLLSVEFVRLTLLANLIAAPLTFLIMRDWLNNFAYRQEMNLMPFLLAAAIALGIALLTVSYQAVKAAIANPIESLRYE